MEAPGLFRGQVAGVVAGVVAGCDYKKKDEARGAILFRPPSGEQVITTRTRARAHRKGASILWTPFAGGRLPKVTNDDVGARGDTRRHPRQRGRLILAGMGSRKRGGVVSWK